jgi:hypothetical protein
VPRCFSLRLVPHHRNPAFALFMTTFSRPPSCIMFSKSAVGCPAPVWHEDRDHRHRSQGTPKPPASATSSGDQSFTCPSSSLPSRHHIAYYFMMIHSRFFFAPEKQCSTKKNLSTTQEIMIRHRTTILYSATSIHLGHGLEMFFVNTEVFAGSSFENRAFIGYLRS